MKVRTEDAPRRFTDIEAIVDNLAERLADPAAVAARMTADENAMVHPDGSRQQLWGPVSLADGYPALALLFAELGHRDDGYRKVAHAYLSQAVAHLDDAPSGGLYAGPVALAFAASCAVRRPSDYLKLLEPLDRSITAWVPRRLSTEWKRIEARRPGTTFASYDVITGMTGVGRYLLQRGSHAKGALTEILRYLVALTRPCPDGGSPGWLVTHAVDGHDRPGEHLNLGMAHGISGPLALLSSAWQEGIRVDGQEDAITRIAQWLCDQRIVGRPDTTWPATIEPSQQAAGPDVLKPSRAAWCYGVPGVARALQLAGQALRQRRWTDIAVDAIRGTLNQRAQHGISDAGLCHGWAGLLHVVRLVGLDADDAELLGASTELAQRVLDCYDEDAPFGFRAVMPPTFDTVDLAGFLEGSAGVALALLSFADGTRPATGWDAALLVN